MDESKTAGTLALELLPGSGNSSHLNARDSNDTTISIAESLQSVVSLRCRSAVCTKGVVVFDEESAVQVEGKVHQNAEELEEANRRRVLISCLIGNTLEWYDFMLYAFLGSTISKAFFPTSNEFAQQLAFYGVFAASFATRPLGGLIFGWIGDKYSRKTALTLSVYCMSIPTTLLGCLPTYDQIGIAAPCILVVLRLLQGLAVGGEFTHTMIFLVDTAPTGRKGFYGSLTYVCVLVGILVGSVIAAIFNMCMPTEMLNSWGWRIPFVVSIFGAAVAVYIRRQLMDIHVDKRVQTASKAFKEILLPMANVFMLDFTAAIGFYTFVIFMPTYLQKQIGFTLETSTLISITNIFLCMWFIPVGGWLTDRFGAFPVLFWPSVISAVITYPAFLLFELAIPALAWATQFVLFSIMTLSFGGLSKTFVTLFPADSVCKGLSVSHNLAVGSFGGTAALMAAAIVEATGSVASPGILVAVAAVLTAVGALMARFVSKVC